MKRLKDIGRQSLFTTDLGELDDMNGDGVEISLAGGRYRVVIKDASADKSEYWIDLFSRVGNKWECLNGFALCIPLEEPKRLQESRKARRKP